MQTAASGTTPAIVWRVEADSGEVLGTPVKNRPAHMKVAISSASFAELLAAGEMTQLEWLERCASSLGADGVVFVRRHFARTDGEYVAQLKKVAVDVGLVPLAIDAPQLFDPALDEAERLGAIELAAGVGALFILTRLPQPGPIPPATFVATVGAAKAAVRAAKRVNITLLAAPAAGTLAGDVPALRHFLKDVDSAWLRYALPAGADRSVFNARDRTLVVTVDDVADFESLPEISADARPWLLLTGAVDASRIAALRRAAAKKTLAAAGVP